MNASNHRPLFAGLTACHLPAILVTCTLLTFALPGWAAEAYPAKPLKFIVPFPTAGTTDVVARIFGGKLSEQLGQPVVIENRVGATGNIGTEAAARSAPDGYTVMLGATPNMVINPALFAKVNFDTVKDFAAIAALGVAPNVLVVNANLPAKTLSEFVSLAKSKPGKILFASGGNGSSGHLAMVMLQDAADIKVTHVPYGGGPQAITDLLGGQVEALFFPAAAMLNLVRAGKLRALASASLKRGGVLPEVPTMEEGGLPRFDASPWFGLFAPAATPRPITDRLQAASTRALATPDLRKQFSDQGVEPMTEVGAEFAALVRADLERWRNVVKKSGATID
jgi:tripartite-type tricarboxylate transporter receptor subunit TctC